MKLLAFIVIIGAIHFEVAHAQLMECFKCTDSTECSKDRDFCDGHNRCLKMEYKNGNGEKVNDAMCSYDSKCDTELGKTILCDKKKDCKILTCCKDNLCNSPAVWNRFDLKLLALIFAAVLYILKQ